MSIKIGELELFTVEELAQLLDIQERTIREYLRDGKLKGRKLGKRWYISELSLREYFQAGEPLDMDEDEAEHEAEHEAIPAASD